MLGFPTQLGQQLLFSLHKMREISATVIQSPRWHRHTACFARLTLQHPKTVYQNYSEWIIKIVTDKSLCVNANPTVSIPEGLSCDWFLCFCDVAHVFPITASYF